MRLLTQNARATHLELTGIFNTLYGILACGETQLEVATSHFLSGVLLSSSSQRKVPVRQVASIIFTRPIMASSCVVATELRSPSWSPALSRNTSSMVRCLQDTAAKHKW
jgi:hypothetical protein